MTYVANVKLDNFLKQIINKLATNATAQDLLETSLWGLGSAGFQALTTDMTPQEIALSTAIGMGAAMATRPVAARAGRALGRMAPVELDDALMAYQKEADLEQLLNFPLPTKAFIDRIEAEDMIPELVKKGLRAKHNADFKDYRPIEGMSGFFGRNIGDNLSQVGTGLIMAQILGGPEEDELLTQAQAYGG